jgi:2-hydroxy-3-keto-5-methylthiopentenyl-1-phosphate phosphatase
MSEVKSRKQKRMKLAQSRWTVLCDFDGTISRKDVGNRMFARFARSGWKDTVEDWKAGLISSRECLMAECSLARATADQIAQFVLTQEIDPHFKRFLYFCRHHSIPVIILSDGLDFYIDLILRKYGLEALPRFANHLVIRGSRLLPRFPYFDQGCGSCGNCKGFHVRRYVQDGNTTIYVGDGYSDRCAVTAADLVFAKGDLRRYCRHQGIAHVPYRDFGDVLRRIRVLVQAADAEERSLADDDLNTGSGIRKKTSRSQRRNR